MPLAAGMNDTSIKKVEKDYVPGTKCDVIVKAKWNNGCKVEIEMFNLSPGVMAELIPWLRERRIDSGREK